MPGDQQVETAAQIALAINGTLYRVKDVDTTVEVTLEMVRGNNVKPQGWGITEANFSGSLSFNGDVSGEITPQLTQGDGVTPVEGCSLVITHMDGSSDIYTDVMMEEESYSSQEGSVTETNYNWVAFDKV